MTEQQLRDAAKEYQLRMPHPNHYSIVTTRLVYPEPAKHQDSMLSLVRAFERLSIKQTTISDLPQETLLNMVEQLAEPWTLTDDLADWNIYKLDQDSRERHRALTNLSTTSRSLAAAATTVLYHCVHLSTAKSVRCFLRTLQMRPDLIPLVKHISCSHEVFMRHSYIFAHSAYDSAIAQMIHGGQGNMPSLALFHSKEDIIDFHELLKLLEHTPRIGPFLCHRTDWPWSLVHGAGFCGWNPEKAQDLRSFQPFITAGQGKYL